MTSAFTSKQALPFDGSMLEVVQSHVSESLPSWLLSLRTLPTSAIHNAVQNHSYCGRRKRSKPLFTPIHLSELFSAVIRLYSFVSVFFSASSSSTLRQFLG